TPAMSPSHWNAGRLARRAMMPSTIAATGQTKADADQDESVVMGASATATGPMYGHRAGAVWVASDSPPAIVTRAAPNRIGAGWKSATVAIRPRASRVAEVARTWGWTFAISRQRRVANTVALSASVT